MLAIRMIRSHYLHLSLPLTSVYAPPTDEVSHPLNASALSPLGERVDRCRRFLQPGRAG